jgi:hypothetical protein
MGRPVWTAMKEGLLGGTFSVSPRSELGEARVHGACWIGSEPQPARCLPVVRALRVLEQFAAPSDLDGPHGLVRRVGGDGLPVRAVIESMTGARFVHDTLERLGWEVLIADAQMVKGLAPLACKTDGIDAQDRRDRRARADAALASRPGAGDLAARPRRARRARAGALPAAPGQAPLDAQASHPLDADHVRAPVPDDRSVRRRRPGAARPSRDPAAVARHRRRQPSADRGPRAPDRRHQPRAAVLGRRPSLRAAAVDRRGDRLGAGVHDRGRDRRHRAVRDGQQAGRLHRPVPEGQPVRQGPPRTAVQARAPSTRAGRCSKPPCTRCDTRATRSATSATSSGSGASAAPGSPRSTSPDGSPRRSGTCSPPTSPSTQLPLREAPLFVWPPGGPFGIAPPQPASHDA